MSFIHNLFINIMQFQSKPLQGICSAWQGVYKRFLEPLLLSSLPKHFGSKAWGQNQGGMVAQSEVLEPGWNKEAVSLRGQPCTVLEFTSEHPWKVNNIEWEIKDWVRLGGIHTGQKDNPAWVFRAWWGKSPAEEVAQGSGKGWGGKGIYLEGTEMEKTQCELLQSKCGWGGHVRRGRDKRDWLQTRRLMMRARLLSERELNIEMNHVGLDWNGSIGKNCFSIYFDTEL